MTDHDGRYSTFGILNLALDHVRLLVAVPLLTLVLAVVLAWIRGPEYMATSTFMAETDQSSVSQLAGLAAQFGFANSLPGQEKSVDFYAGLATSHATLEAAATRQYRFATAEGAPDTLSGDIPHLLEVEGKTPEQRLRSTVRLLRERVQADADRNAGVVVVTTRSPWPGLTLQLNHAILDAVNTFDLEKRQTRAAAERRFVEQQLAGAREDLIAAEGELETFLEKNRRYEEWPQLRFQEQRLQRRVDLLQQLYTSLAQSLQQARIEEVRTTPVVTVVAPPEMSLQKATSLRRTAVLGLLLGLTLAIGYISVNELARRERERTPIEYGRFRKRSRALIRR